MESKAAPEHRNQGAMLVALQRLLSKLLSAIRFVWVSAVSECFALNGFGFPSTQTQNVSEVWVPGGLLLKRRDLRTQPVKWWNDVSWFVNFQKWVLSHFKWRLFQPELFVTFFLITFAIWVYWPWHSRCNAPRAKLKPFVSFTLTYIDMVSPKMSTTA